MRQRTTIKRRLLSFLITLAMVAGLLPGMSLAVYAEVISENVGAAVNLLTAVSHTHGEGADAIVFQPWTSNNSLPGEGSWYLTQDVTLGGTHVISQTLNLCLNGKTVSPSTGMAFYNSLISISGESAVLNLYDDEGETGTISVKDRAVETAVSLERGVFNMYGGIILGGDSDWPETGVNGEGGMMSGGSRTFNMHGGKITGLYTGVRAHETNFTMSGGEICGNGKNSEGWTDNAGVDFGAYEGTYDFVITGGSIHDNTGDNGGVCIRGENAQVQVSGDVKIYNNTRWEHKGGETLNLFLKEEQVDNRPVITLIGALGEEATIGVTALYWNNTSADYHDWQWETYFGTVARGSDTYSITENDTARIHSDNPDYSIVLSDGEAKLVSHIHSFTYTTENGVITATCANANGNCDLAGSDVTLTLNAPTLTVAGETGEGISAEATLTGLDEFKEALGLADDPEIIYYTAVKSDGVYTKGEQLTAAPSDAGDYIAEVSVPVGQQNVVTASVGYTIDAPLAPVPYLDWDETTGALVLKTGDEACEDYIAVGADTTTFEDGKWYVVSSDVTVENGITVSGDAHLILCDNAKLTAGEKITASDNSSSLVIHAQSTGENMGSLFVHKENETINFKGDLTINGGCVDAETQNAWGINVGGALTINGGVLTARSNGAYAIFTGGTFTINSGAVKAESEWAYTICANGNLVINGGTTEIECQRNYAVLATRGIDITGGSFTVTSNADSAIRSYGKINVSGGSITAVSNSNAAGIYAYDDVDVSGGSVTGTGYIGIYCSGFFNVSDGSVTASGSNQYGLYSSRGITVSGGSITAAGNRGSIRGTVKNAIAGAGWTDTEGTEGETAIEVSTEGQTLENYKKVVIPYVHTHTFGKNPRWQWSFIDGKPVVTVSTTCSCGETEEGTATVTGAESADHSQITYTAADAYGNTDDRTYDLTFTVEYNNETYTYKYGDTCKLTADVVSDWSVEGVLRAEGTKTFYFPVTGNVTVTSAVNEQAQQQNAMISVTEAVGGTKNFSCKVLWSLPEGAKVKSTMIYRCKDNDFECRTAEALLGATNLRSFNMKLNVRNGQFMYTATNLTSGSCQTVMAQVVYTLNGKTFTIHTEPQNIAIQ